MSTILAFIEHDCGSVGKIGRSVCGAAQALKSTHGHNRIVGLVLGDSSAKNAAEVVAKLGVDEVIFIEAGDLKQCLALTYGEVICSVMQDVSATVLIGAATTTGKDIFPWVAGKLQAGQASDVLEFLPGGLFRRPMYAGNILADVDIVTANKVVTIRATAFPVPVEATSAPVKSMAIVPGKNNSQTFVAYETVKSERPELSNADVVVSGGRALKSAEGFMEVVGPLADALGAAIGASRAAVDSGYAPNDWQVGQTGKVVAPNLYIAVGISGAIQHLAGMKDSKVIVAINKDPDAPIFEVADYGIVGDLFQIVPELTAEILKLK